MKQGLRIGIDLGGTKTELVALDQGGQILLRRRRPTPQGDYAATVKNIVDLIAEAEASLARQASVGVAIPGSISSLTGKVKNANSLCLNGQALQNDLEEALNRPVRLANDANCFALSEAVDGAAAGEKTVFGVILGTGAGAGLVVNQQLLLGPNGIAGEWGHNPMPWMSVSEFPGPRCWCGKDGCIETFVSGPGLSADYERVVGVEYTAEELVLLAEQGDDEAGQCLNRYMLRLAKALAAVINIVDPDVIVLGGGLSNMKQIYHEVPSLWGSYVFSDEVNNRLVQAKYGDSSGVRGAAWLWPE